MRRVVVVSTKNGGHNENEDETDRFLDQPHAQTFEVESASQAGAHLRRRTASPTRPASKADASGSLFGSEGQSMRWAMGTGAAMLWMLALFYALQSHAAAKYSAERQILQDEAAGAMMHAERLEDEVRSSGPSLPAGRRVRVCVYVFVLVRAWCVRVVLGGAHMGHITTPNSPVPVGGRTDEQMAFTDTGRARWRTCAPR